MLSLVAGTATEKTCNMETLSTYKSVHCTEVELSGILRVLQGGKYSKCSDVEESDCGSMNYDDVTMYWLYYLRQLFNVISSKNDSFMLYFVPASKPTASVRVNK